MSRDSKILMGLLLILINFLMITMRPETFDGPQGYALYIFNFFCVWGLYSVPPPTSKEEKENRALWEENNRLKENLKAWEVSEDARRQELKKLGIQDLSVAAVIAFGETQWKAGFAQSKQNQEERENLKKQLSQAKAALTEERKKAGRQSENDFRKRQQIAMDRDCAIERNAILEEQLRHTKSRFGRFARAVKAWYRAERSALTRRFIELEWRSLRMVARSDQRDAELRDLATQLSEARNVSNRSLTAVNSFHNADQILSEHLKERLLEICIAVRKRDSTELDRAILRCQDGFKELPLAEFPKRMVISYGLLLRYLSNLMRIRWHFHRKDWSEFSDKLDLMIEELMPSTLRTYSNGHLNGVRT